MLTVDKLPIVKSAEELEAVINEIGFIPFFDCGLPGFSVKAICDPFHWFNDKVDGPWEWKSAGHYAYAKLLRGKAVFITPEWYGIFACMRRDGYDFEGMYEDGLLPRGAFDIAKKLEAGSMLSTRLREETGLTGKNSDFDKLINLLQMKCFVLPSAFEYAVSKNGRPYGWGLARYALADKLYYNEITAAESSYSPRQAKEKILRHILALCPDCTEKRAISLIR